MALPVRAQGADAAAPAPQQDEIAALVARLQDILATGDRDQLAALVSRQANALDTGAFDRFAEDFISSGVLRGVALERDRTPLQGALPGDGYRLIVEFCAEIERHARLMTARVDVQRSAGGGADSWRIVDAERLSLVDGLHRLSLDTASPLTARNFRV